MKPVIILDVDGSVQAMPGQQLLPMADWQERLRFGCGPGVMRRFRRFLDEQLPAVYGTVMLGSGDFHHLSWPLIQRLDPPQPFEVVVLDNHPDNMRYPFGVHCGSWVRRVAMLPLVSHVHVLGITSADIGADHAWENYRRPLREGRLSYWSIGVDVSWAHKAGLDAAFRAFDSADALVRAFVQQRKSAPRPVYLSIDKDVFDESVARTNWDQGCLKLAEARAIIESLRAGGLVGSDITGEVSIHHYRSWWKRWLSSLDQQPDIDPAQLAAWQAQQQALNTELLELIGSLPPAS